MDAKKLLALTTLKLPNKPHALQQYLDLQSAKPACPFKVVGGVVVADQDEALKFAAACEPGLDVFR